MKSMTPLNKLFVEIPVRKISAGKMMIAKFNYIFGEKSLALSRSASLEYERTLTRARDKD